MRILKTAACFLYSHDTSIQRLTLSFFFSVSLERAKYTVKERFKLGLTLAYQETSCMQDTKFSKIILLN